LVEQSFILDGFENGYFFEALLINKGMLRLDV